MQTKAKAPTPRLTERVIHATLLDMLLENPRACFDADDEFVPPAHVVERAWQLFAAAEPKPPQHWNLFVAEAIEADEFEAMLIRFAADCRIADAMKLLLMVRSMLAASATKRLQDFEGDIRAAMGNTPMEDE